jgi:hypothetical protein
MDLNVRTLFNGCNHGNSFYASIIVIICTAKTLYQKFETNIPRIKMRGLIPNTYIHVSVSDLYVYSQDRSPILLQPNRQTDDGNI